MKRNRHRLVAGLLSFGLTAATAGAQSVNLIESEVDGLRHGLFELGPFQATPVLRFSTGYDSNALSTPDPQEDISAMIGPGIHLGLPVGSKAFLDLFQELDYVWYRDHVDLRRIFDITRVGGGFGGRRFLVEVNDEFRHETARPSSEFDFPVEVRTNQLKASLTLALGWRQELRTRYEQSRSEIREGSIDDPTVPERLNNTRDLVAVDLSRKMTDKTRAVFEGFFEQLTFDDLTRNSDSYGGRAGFQFSREPRGPQLRSVPSSGISGRFLLGFRKLVPNELSRVDYTGLIGSGDVAYAWRGGNRVHGLYSRDLVPSIFDDNWFFVERRFGGSFRWQLHERLGIEPGAIRGKNDYPLPMLEEGENGEVTAVPIVDEHTTYSLTLDYRIRPTWTIGVTSEYFDRHSNLFGFDKDRLVVRFHMALTP